MNRVDAGILGALFYLYIMKPKLKAKELIKKHYKFVSRWTSTSSPLGSPTAQYEGLDKKFERAKQCALISVKELITESSSKTSTIRWHGCNLTDKEYWKEVEQEILIMTMDFFYYKEIVFNPPYNGNNNIA